MSDQPYLSLTEQVDSMTIAQAIHAKQLIDSKLGKAGVVELTGDAAFRAFKQEMRQNMKAQTLVSIGIQNSLQQHINKKGDITSVRVGNHGTLNLLGLGMLLFKIDEKWPLTPMVEGAIDHVMRFI